MAGNLDRVAAHAGEEVGHHLAGADEAGHAQALGSEAGGEVNAGQIDAEDAAILAVEGEGAVLAGDVLQLAGAKIAAHRAHLV